MANINNIENIKTLQSWDVPVVIHRTNAQPIDNASYFTQLSDAENYALSGATSYVGQELFVVNTTLSTANVYVIQDISGSIKKLATTFVGKQTQSSVTGDFTDLSVIKISRADYEQAVVDAASNGVDLSDNVLYVISSDYIDAYERQIKNVVMEDDNTPSDAVNKHFVEQLSDRISQTIDNNIDAICAVISNDISGYIHSISDTIDNNLCVAIFDNADDISTKIWIENRVDKSISAFSDLSVVTLSKDQYAAEMANKSPYGNMDKNVLYLISSDNLDMFGQKIENLTMTDDSTQSEAATQHYVDNLSVNQSSSFNAKINALSANLSGEIDSLSSRLSTEICSLSTSLSNDVKKLSSDLSGEIGSLSTSLSTEISNLSTDLSNAISSKVFVGEYTQSTISGNFTDLSVIKISKDDYEVAVATAAKSRVDLSDNVLYVISSDYIDAYEQQIKNVVMEDDNTPSEAATKHYVDQAYNADNVYFKDNITMTYAFGKYAPAAGEGSFILSCAGKSIANVLKEAYSQTNPPNVTQPTITLTVEATSNPLTGEVGVSYTVPRATLKFKRGTYEFANPIDNTGVSIPAASAVISCITELTSVVNNTAISNNNDTSFYLPAGTANAKTFVDDEKIYEYSTTARWTDGDIPKNNIGDNDASSQIKSDTATQTKSFSAIGHRFGFFGYRTASEGRLNYANITSDDIRSNIHAIKWDAKTTNGNWPTSFTIKQGTIQLIFAVPENASGFDEHKYIKMNNTARGDWPDFEISGSGASDDKSSKVQLRDTSPALSVDGASSGTAKKYYVWTSMSDVPFGEDAVYTISYSAS